MNTDELARRLNECADDWRINHKPAALMKEAATALLAAEQRERELVEALDIERNSREAILRAIYDAIGLPTDELRCSVAVLHISRLRDAAHRPAAEQEKKS